MWNFLDALVSDFSPLCGLEVSNSPASVFYPVARLNLDMLVLHVLL